MNKNLKFILIFITLFIIIYLIFFIINNILIPSYHSVVSVCYPKIAEQQGIKAGAEAFIYFNETTKTRETQINYFVPPTKRIIKHELCHVNQNKRDVWFINSCVFPIQKWFREIEAYSCEYIPNYIYEKIYEEIPELK